MLRTTYRRYYTIYNKKIKYNDYIKNTINPLFWLKFNETSGTSIVNYGSIGGTGVWTSGIGSIGQTGYYGENQAYDYDGNNSKVQFTNASILDVANLTTQKGFILANFDSLGESSSGFFFGYGTGASHFVRFTTLNRLIAFFNTNSTDASVTSDVNQVSDLLGNWRYLFWDFDNDNILENGRKIRIFKSIPETGVITPITFGGGDVEATGTIIVPTDDLVVGNITSQVRTLDGKLDEFLITSGLWNNQQMQYISKFRASDF